MPRRPVTQHNRRMAGPDHAVIELRGGLSLYRRTPCDGCPWIVANTGDFPAEAFRHSAGTAFDASMHSFACHESGRKAPATCAGFLLRNSAHNLAVRIRQSAGDILDPRPSIDEVQAQPFPPAVLERLPAHLATEAVDDGVARELAGGGDDLGLVDDAESDLLRHLPHALPGQHDVLFRAHGYEVTLDDRHQSSLSARAGPVAAASPAPRSARCRRPRGSGRARPA